MSVGSITVYEFLYDDGRECDDIIYDYYDAKQYARDYCLRLVEVTYEYSGDKEIENYTGVPDYCPSCDTSWSMGDDVDVDFHKCLICYTEFNDEWVAW